MKKKKKILLGSLTSILTAFTVVGLTVHEGNMLGSLIADNDPYTITFDSSTKDLNFDSGKAQTKKGNLINVSSSSSSMKSSVSNQWATFTENQYFSNTTAINSMYKFVLNYSGDDTSFLLYYGDSLDALDRSYLIASGVPYDLSKEKPTYFKLVSNSKGTASVTDFKIYYECSCKPAESYDGVKVSAGYGAAYFGYNVATPGSYDGKIKYSFSISHEMFSNSAMPFIFDLTPSIGALYNAANGGNGITFYVPQSGAQTVSPNGFNKYMMNNPWGYWLTSEDTTTTHESTTAGSSMAIDFGLHEARIKSWPDIQVIAEWDFTNKDFGLYLRSSNGKKHDLVITSVLTIDSTKSYYPCIYFADSTVGGHFTFDKLTFERTGSDPISDSVTIENTNSITYDKNDTKNHFVFSDKAHCKLVKDSEFEDLVDFVVDVPEGKTPYILQLTDIQVIDSSQMLYSTRLNSWTIDTWGPDKLYDRAWRHMRQTVKTVSEQIGRKPDLIVLTGDNTYGEFDMTYKNLNNIIKELDSYGIPFAMTYGNHDLEAGTGLNISSSSIGTGTLNTDYVNFTEVSSGLYHACAKQNVAYMDYLYATSKCGLFMKGHAGVEGHGNYTVGLRQGGKLIGANIMFDSHGNTYNDESQQVYCNSWCPCVKDSQRTWLANTTAALNAAGVNSLAYCHHALLSFALVGSWYGIPAPKNNIKARDNQGAEIDIGFPSGGYEDIENRTSLGYGIDSHDHGCIHLETGVGQYFDEDSSIHQLSLDNGIKGWFFGHEHRINATITRGGIRYCYGLKASEYDDYQPGEVGGTLIKFGSDVCTENIYA